MINSLIVFGSVVTAILAIGGVIVGIIKWIFTQNKQSEDIVALKKKHDADMVAIKEQEKADVQAVRDELCVLSYAMLAALDGLKQLHCNGEVTKAHDKLEKHLNQTAHGQNSNK